jgi:hypothetical protein
MARCVCAYEWRPSSSMYQPDTKDKGSCVLWHMQPERRHSSQQPLSAFCSFAFASHPHDAECSKTERGAASVLNQAPQLSTFRQKWSTARTPRGSLRAAPKSWMEITLAPWEHSKNENYFIHRLVRLNGKYWYVESSGKLEMVGVVIKYNFENRILLIFIQLHCFFKVM